MAKTKPRPAYFLVDIAKIPENIRAEVIEDAAFGGKDYGVQVVEIVHNGTAQSPIYGVYYDVEPAHDGSHQGRDDETRWNEFKAENGMDDDVDEEAVRESAAAVADEAAERQKAADDAALAAIDNGEGGEVVNKNKK